MTWVTVKIQHNFNKTFIQNHLQTIQKHKNDCKNKSQVTTKNNIYTNWSTPLVASLQTSVRKLTASQKDLSIIEHEKSTVYLISILLCNFYILYGPFVYIKFPLLIVITAYYFCFTGPFKFVSHIWILSRTKNVVCLHYRAPGSYNFSGT